ncbi:DDRGK domain-containing protein [Haloplanus natans]|uniref:hypothetical protein n=1 Tax=Haloplanus natans TaxID=376171 RepID=UPI0012FB5F56|nr:hypothetical protein [Haloplanus natans]
MRDHEDYLREERKPVEPRKEDLSNLPSAAEERAEIERQHQEELRRKQRRMMEDRQRQLDALAAEEKLRMMDQPDPLQRSGKSVAAKYTLPALKKCVDTGLSTTCKNCGAKPFSEGPHHTCSREEKVLRLSTDLAHKYSCGECNAQPFVPGVHHRRDCSRRLKKKVKDVVENRDYSTPCKYCGVKPFSQGPHHDSDCDRKWSYVAYSTKLAHMYNCAECDARPFVAGPHHKDSCSRHFYSTVF